MSDDPFEARVRESFARQHFMATIGAELDRVASGEVDVSLPFDAALTQQHGFLHAGVLASALDTACGYAALTLMPAEAAVVSVEFKINLLAPAVGDRFVARGRVLRAGRTLTVCRGDGFALGEGAETHVATVVATMIALHGRAGMRD